MASCTVAEPSAPSFVATSPLARWMLRYTTPSSYMSKSFCLERRIQARIHAARVAFVNLVARFGLDARRLDIALRVVEIMPRFRIDAAHRADHLAREQNV